MLIVVGSYNQDLVWRTPRFPKAGETRTGLFSQGPGGKGFNQAMAAREADTSREQQAGIANQAAVQNVMEMAQRGEISDDRLRLMKRANEILPLGQINASLAAE